MATITAWLLLAPRVARAEPATFDLSWSAPAECPSREAIVDATRTRLGASRSDEPPALFVHGAVTPERGGFLVSLAMRDRSNNPVGQRQVHVEGPSCTAVADATALVLAMIIAARPRAEPPTTTSPIEPPPVAPIAPESASPTPAAARPPLEKPSPRGPPRRLTIGAAGAVSRGVLPGLGVGVALRATYSPVPLLVFGIEASVEAGGSIEDTDSEVDFQLVSAAALAGVPVLRTDRFELILTLGARGGAIRTSSVGLRRTEDGLRPVALVGPGALMRVRLLPSLFLEAAPQLEAVVVRDRFHIRDGETVYPIHRAAPIEGRFSLGILYEFP